VIQVALCPTECKVLLPNFNTLESDKTGKRYAEMLSGHYKIGLVVISDSDVSTEKGCFPNKKSLFFVAKEYLYMAERIRL